MRPMASWRPSTCVVPGWGATQRQGVFYAAAQVPVVVCHRTTFLQVVAQGYYRRVRPASGRAAMGSARLGLGAAAALAAVGQVGAHGRARAIGVLADDGVV